MMANGPALRVVPLLCGDKRSVGRPNPLLCGDKRCAGAILLAGYGSSKGQAQVYENQPAPG
jgi:hypothetical protein